MLTAQITSANELTLISVNSYPIHKGGLYKSLLCPHICEHEGEIVRK